MTYSVPGVNDGAPLTTSAEKYNPEFVKLYVSDCIIPWEAVVKITELDEVIIGFPAFASRVNRAGPNEPVGPIKPWGPVVPSPDTKVEYEISFV